MLDFSHIPTGTGSANVQIFTGSSTAVGGDWQTWIKPRGKAFGYILLIGKGGNGGNGAVGAASTAGGGGGGGSGGQIAMLIPLSLLPDVLYLSLAGQSATTTLASYIAISPKLTAGAGAPVVNDTLMYANGGGNGGNGGAGTGGSVGAAGAISTTANMPLGWAYSIGAIAGQAGILGGTTAAGANLTLPVTGLLITGGTGGGGLPGVNSSGTVGGSFVVAGQFPAHPGGTGGTNAPTAGNPGTSGYQPIPKLGYNYGGTGGGSSGTSAGSGSNGGNGGNGAFGCGGGGGGGAFTAMVGGVGGNGGPALAIITCW